MNIEMNAASGPAAESQRASSASLPPMRLFAWSIRRELWENRSIYIAPLVVAALVLVGFLIANIGRAMAIVDPVQRAAVLAERNSFASGLITTTALIVAVFYCLDALHGERRDRSILFWKSLPVSDLITVLSKAAIPLVVLPLITLVIVVGTQLVMRLVSTAALLMSGLSAAMPTTVSLIQQPLILLYAMVVLALWYAPIYAWLLLVSAWARRATFLWAVLPPVALSVAERIAFGTTHLASILKSRLIGFATEAFEYGGYGTIDSLSQLTPLRYLGAPGLWIGLVFAALLLAAAIRMRRYRDPI